MKKVAVLTAGGDCPGLNAVIRAIVHRFHDAGGEVVGLRLGYQGLAERAFLPLPLAAVSGFLTRGGTMLGTSAFDPTREPEGVERCRAALADEGIDAIIAIGGDHTMHISRKLVTEHGLPVVGVPKTIDNDIVGTDWTFGFDTAVHVATEAIDRLRTTAASHDRIIVLEVMGADAGWIAVHAGMAGGADAILIPELSLTVADIAAAIRKRHARGKRFSIVVVAEGALLRRDADDPGAQVLHEGGSGRYHFRRLGGIGEALALALEEELQVDTRAVVLGHVQRGGIPTSTDRILATRYGIAAAECALRGEFGGMVALRGGTYTTVPLADVHGIKTVDPETLRDLELLLV
ncbi:ATP-dependent 6-phosphofructokinase [Conexibacter sp. W3-3-2]|uniref:6-phosphofructokinase n=1 Tax=Paraconexibacter algicola TaxID=2133960 RepID=A0A2T4UDW5_9ACTN|nr:MULTISPECIES: ATP-dependent 6-phosphofructokinase [Solirubrobacterales]MTD43967.1 ATP-dependent 6-phosphofructokinase [Conexibacter sp. W3-3-2]PTL55698.1 6-phosphofructokinase [Paraconexibacter algicola]